MELERPFGGEGGDYVETVVDAIGGPHKVVAYFHFGTNA